MRRWKASWLWTPALAICTLALLWRERQLRHVERELIARLAPLRPDFAAGSRVAAGWTILPDADPDGSPDDELSPFDPADVLVSEPLTAVVAGYVPNFHDSAHYWPRVLDPIPVDEDYYPGRRAEDR